VSNRRAKSVPTKVISWKESFWNNPLGSQGKGTFDDQRFTHQGPAWKKETTDRSGGEDGYRPKVTRIGEGHRKEGKET